MNHSDNNEKNEFTDEMSDTIEMYKKLMYLTTGDASYLETPPPPKPLTDEEYAQRLEFYNQIFADYSARVKEAFGSRKVKALEETLSSFISRDNWLEASFDTWKTVVKEICTIFCSSCIYSKLKYSSRANREKLTEKN